MSESEKRERPAVITLLCILVFAGAAFSLLGINSSFNRSFGTAYQVYFAAMTLVNLVAFAAIWKMKKWGVVLYCVVAVVHMGVVFQVIHYNIITLLLAVALNVLFIAILIYNFSKMD